MGKRDRLPDKMFCLNCRVVTDVKINLSDSGLASLTCQNCGGVQEIVLEDKTQPITKRG